MDNNAFMDLLISVVMVDNMAHPQKLEKKLKTFQGIDMIHFESLEELETLSIKYFGEIQDKQEKPGDEENCPLTTYTFKNGVTIEICPEHKHGIVKRV